MKYISHFVRRNFVAAQPNRHVLPQPFVIAKINFYYWTLIKYGLLGTNWKWKVSLMFQTRLFWDKVPTLFFWWEIWIWWRKKKNIVLEKSLKILVILMFILLLMSWTVALTQQLLNSLIILLRGQCQRDRWVWCSMFRAHNFWESKATFLFNVETVFEGSTKQVFSNSLPSERRVVC